MGYSLALENRVIVNQSNVATTLGGTIDSSKEYFIDGIIDCTGVIIEVPIGGINIKGYDFDISKLICSDASYTMFTSPIGGSGNVLIADIAIEVTGVTSKVYDIFSNTGFEAIEVDKINYNDCTSLGIIDNYRQGLETGTGRFGGTPELELKGAWIGGYFIDTSIVRSLSNAAFTLYKAGAGFLMSSRFRSNQNIDLPALASFVDFTTSNFVNPSTLQFDGLIISRNGVFNTDDLNYTPNISKSDLASSWNDNAGLPNTFVGGFLEVVTQLETTINTVDVAETIVATAWSSRDLEHFSNPSVGQLKHLGITPREFKITYDLHLKGTANKVITIRIKKYDDSLATFVTVFDQQRVVNNLVGANDVAFFNINTNVTLDLNDYIYLEVINNTDSSNVTLENDSFFRVEKR